MRSSGGRSKKQVPPRWGGGGRRASAGSNRRGGGRADDDMAGFVLFTICAAVCESDIVIGEGGLRHSGLEMLRRMVLDVVWADMIARIPNVWYEWHLTRRHMQAQDSCARQVEQ